MKELALSLPGNTTTVDNPTPYHNLGELTTGGLNLVFYITFFLMFFWMAWGVFQYIFAGGEKESLSKAQKRITWAIVGFIIVMAAFLLYLYFQTLIPQALPKGVTPISVPPPLNKTP